jgi:hypothetical protein
VRRYDVDGVQFDDYFYPDPSEADGVDFPDDASWARYGTKGTLGRGDWRRENVNTFIRCVYRSIKAAKPWVKFGISPFGIWRPGFPPQIKGKDAYAVFYADSHKWLANGWLDYFSPQLYWPIAQKEQSFPVLLNWWAQQNPKGRHLWPGLAAYKSGEWGGDEILNQIRLVRKQPGARGCAFYNASSLFANSALTGKLQREVFAEPALVPASTWLGTGRPGRPVLSIKAGLQGPPVISWTPSGTNRVRQWVLQTLTGTVWKMEVSPAEVNYRVFKEPAPELIAVSAVDRGGNASIPAVLQMRRETVKTPRGNSPKTTHSRSVSKWPI